MLHQARLRHRGFPQIVHDQRFMMSLDIVSNLAVYRTYFSKTWHGKTKGATHEARSKLFAKRLEAARAEMHNIA